jgi:fucose permease
MGVAGGAVIPMIMGIVADRTGQVGAMVVLLLAIFYLVYTSFKVDKN